MNIREIFKSSYSRYWKKHEARYGIEIETETASSAEYPKDFLIRLSDYEFQTPLELWRCVVDGSLRNFGLEYVLKEPMHFAEIGRALDEFAVKTSAVKFMDTHSTSVHVHVNFLPETLGTLGSFLTLWTLFENILVDFCGPTRRNNLFALPARVAEESTYNIENMFKKINDGNVSPFYLNEEAAKYGAINIVPLKGQGSVEIRCFKGSTDYSEIFFWVSVLESLMRFSQKYQNPDLILDRYRFTELDNFGREIFGSSAWSRLIQTVPDPKVYVHKNLWLAFTIANSVDNWDLVEQKYKKAEKPQKLDIKTIPAADGLTNIDFSQFLPTTPTAPDPWIVVDDYPTHNAMNPMYNPEDYPAEEYFENSEF